MRVKHLTLQGYKSFATRTDFLFSDGITAIIGPNGSGKSNVADAIRWVLGEQSMRTLRGKSTADMIFAGGRRRAQAGMAEVSLVFDNTEGWLPIDFTEVTITRRAYRSGDNEYLINGSRVRLRDVSDMLAQSGLSLGGYAIIGQGLIDAALSLRAQERRRLFEEAAGIALYRSRREETLKRLDDTQRNMDRVRDIANEIEPRVRRLAREAERAEEHRRATAHLKRLQRTWYGYQSGRLQNALSSATERAVAVKDLLTEHQHNVEVLSQQLADLSSREGKLRAQLRDWHRETSRYHGQADRVRRELAVTEERAHLLSARKNELTAELESMRRQHESQAQRLSDVRTEAERLTQEMAEHQVLLTKAEQVWTGLKERAAESIRRHAEVEREIQKHRRYLEQLNQTLIQARQRFARLENEQAVAWERVRQLAIRQEKIAAELEPAQQQEKEQSERVAAAQATYEQMEYELSERVTWVANLEREWKASLSRRDAPELRQTEIEQAIKDHRAQLQKLEEALRQAHTDAARVEGEYQALSRLHNSSRSYDAGVQALLQAGIEGVIGPLAALIQVPREWESAIGIALGDDLQAVVVEKAAVLSQVKQVLDASDGRLILLPLDALRPPPPLPSDALCAADAVLCEDHVRPAVTAVLGRVVLCEEMDGARELLSHLPPGSRCVLRSGAVLRADGALVVGRAGSSNVLASERALRELPVEMQKAKQRCDELEREQSQVLQRIAALEKDRDAVIQEARAEREARARLEQDKLNEARTRLAVAKESLRNQRDLLQRELTLLGELQAQAAALRNQSMELKSEHEALVARFGSWQTETAAPAIGDGKTARSADSEEAPMDSAELVKARRMWEQAERQYQEEAQHIADLEAELQELSETAATENEAVARFERETLSPARTQVAVAREALRSQQATLQRELNLLEQSDAQISARRKRIEELQQEEMTVAKRMQELREETARIDKKLSQLRKQIRPAEEEMARLTEEQADKEALHRQAQENVHATESHFNQAQLEISRCQDALDSLSRRIQEDLGLVELELVENVTAQTPLPLKPLVSRLPIVEILPEELEDEMKRLKSRLSRMRAVNPNAPEEYNETKKRHNFLTEQLADLETASAQLHEAIAELDTMIETSFRETFQAVAAAFSETFQSLFNGGSARLELTDPQDLLNSGVDIVARPPGKRAQRLALLSGGERALTAAALLFALLRVSSTPFCILDEVDAMLDEANVGRFRSLLEEMSKETQFIVITHNRGTVEAAETIYGVSIDKDAVSQVVSLQLD